MSLSASNVTVPEEHGASAPNVVLVYASGVEVQRLIQVIPTSITPVAVTVGGPERHVFVHTGGARERSWG